MSRKEKIAAILKNIIFLKNLSIEIVRNALNIYKAILKNTLLHLEILTIFA